MKVCDKCKEPIKSATNGLKLKDKSYELCERCISKIELWMLRPQGIAATFGSMFGGTR